MSKTFGQTMRKSNLKQVYGNLTKAKSYCQNIVICKMKPFHTLAAVWCGKVSKGIYYCAAINVVMYVMYLYW